MDSKNAKWWVLVAVGGGTFMSALDASIVSIVLPRMREEFGVDISRIEWVVSIYLLVVSAVLLSFGRLGDLKGHRGVYLGGFSLFIVSSALCGYSPSELSLIAFRALQAIGGAMLFAASPAILTASFPRSQRGQALGMQATMTYLGLTVGPPLGGWLADAFSWRAIFYVNVPVGLVVLALAWRVIPKTRPATSNERFDITGAVVFGVELVLLLAALNRGHGGRWASADVVVPLVLALVLGVVFLRIERRSVAPMLDLRLFADRVFSASAASAFLNYMAVYHVVLVLPFYLLEARGLSASAAGLVLAVQSIVMAVVAPLSGTLSDRIGSSRLLTAGGMGLMAIAFGLMSTLTPETPMWQVAFALGLLGLGTGTFISPNNSALMGAAPVERQGIASGVLALSRNVGMVVGVGVAGAVLNTSLGGAAETDAQALSRAVGLTLLAAGVFSVLGAVTSLAARQQTAEG